MGITTALYNSGWCSQKSEIMNKFLAISCLAAVAVAKPEADAEADPALLYGAYGYGGLGYAHAGYAGYPYAAHGLGYAGYAGLGYALPHAAGLASAAVPAVAGGYAGAGRYVANSAGVVHVAKRPPEAEADPALLYGSYGYPYAGVYGGYSTYAAY